MTRCQVTFSFPNSISLLTLWGDANPRETPILAICINKPGIFPNITHFTQKGLFSPQVLCNSPIPSSTAASLSLFSLLLISLFHLQLAASFSCPPPVSSQGSTWISRAINRPSSQPPISRPHRCCLCLWKNSLLFVCLISFKTRNYVNSLSLTRVSFRENKSQDDFENPQSDEKVCR